MELKDHLMASGCSSLAAWLNGAVVGIKNVRAVGTEV